MKNVERREFGRRGMMNIGRRRLLVGATTLALHPLTGFAQSPTTPVWPTRPVKVIVPVAAGTATDLTARIFGERLSTLWGQTIIVENKPGADGLIALGSFVAGRDDHTLLFSFSTAVSLNPMIYAKLPYDPALDLVPITTTSEVLFAIAVHQDVKAVTIKELGALALLEPGKMNWAAAPGLPRFVLERHFRGNKLALTYVGYNQTNAAVTDLGEGRIQVMIAALNTLWPVIEGRKVKVLAIAAPDRSTMLPSAESAMEAGFPDLSVPAVGCVYGWRDMPLPLRDRLALDIDLAAQDPSLVAQLGRVGQIVRRSTPDALAKLLVQQRQSLAPLADIMAVKQ
jgi:tripartite-type tricarboxylate transporter receptor subunit TctC